mmetsp:Transcript_98843/g.166442  ORF Transcript_98843/g.166442 Transcript_98843/m.166442 type:complete len:114 (-) Transcript_98843:931-1272(-)
MESSPPTPAGASSACFATILPARPQENAACHAVGRMPVFVPSPTCSLVPHHMTRNPWHKEVPQVAHKAFKKLRQCGACRRHSDGGSMFPTPCARVQAATHPFSILSGPAAFVP